MMYAFTLQVRFCYSSDTPMSPAIGDIDLIGFYPSLSRDGAVVSDKHSGTTDYFSNMSHSVFYNAQKHFKSILCS